MSVVDLRGETKRLRRVRTPDGVRKFSQPIGSVIVADAPIVRDRRLRSLFNLNDGRGAIERRLRLVADALGVDPYDVSLEKLKAHADEHERDPISRLPTKSPCWASKTIDFTVHRWLPGVLAEKYPDLADALLETSPRWGKRARPEGTLPLPKMKHLLGLHDQASHAGGRARAWTPAGLLAKAREVEPQVTEDLKGATAYAGGDLVMLDKRLKTEAAIEGRIERNRQAAIARGKEPDDELAAKGVPDVLRYTATFDDEAYTGGSIRLMKALNALGYRAHYGGWGNSWKGSSYKGLNLRLVPPDSDQIFELQLHTPASLAAKRETHQMYEAARLLPDFSKVRQELERRMRDVSAGVAVPPGAEGLNWRGETWKDDLGWDGS